MQRLRFKNLVPESEHCHFQRTWMNVQRQPALHSHDFHELFWVGQGRAEHLVNDGRHRLEAGMLVLVHADDVHGFDVSSDESFLLTNVAFARETWAYLCQRYASSTTDPLNVVSSERQYRLSPGDIAELDVLAAELMHGARNRRTIDRFLLNVLYLLDRHRSSDFPAGAPEWLVQACRAVQNPKHFRKGTAGLVTLAGHSAEHVAREVRRWLDKTPTDVVNLARLTHAASQLAQTDDPVTDIALDCGYENISHFYRLFKVQYGVSPGHYRKRQQQIIVPAG